MDNNLSAFERKLRETYEQFEAPYDQSQWRELEKELDIAAPTTLRYFGSITTGIAATGLVFMMMLFLFSDVDTTHNVSTLAEQVNSNEDGNSSDIASVPGISDISEADADTSSAGSDLTTVEDFGGDQSKSQTTASQSTSSKSSPKKASSKSIKDSKNQTKNKPANASSDKLVRSGCTGFTIDFDAGDEHGKDAKYLWNFGDGYFSNDRNPSHTFNRAGTFDVSLSVTSYSTGQISSNVVQGMIYVVEAPISQVAVDVVNANQLVLRNKSFRASDIEWLINNKSSGNGNNLAINLADNTRFEIQLAAFSKVGCTDTLTAIIESSHDSSLIPSLVNAGMLENFEPSKYFTDGKVESFKIFDSRSGKLVYEFKGLNSEKKIVFSTGEYKWVCMGKKETTYTVYSGEFDVK